MAEEAVQENWQAEEPQPMSKMTLAQLEQLIQQVYAEQGEVERLETDLAEKTKLLNHTKGRILSVMQEFKMPSYRTHRGLFVRQRRFNITMPKDPKARDQFFGYLKEQDIFDQLITVNSQTLNSYYKGQMEAAAAEGGGEDFSIPGLEQPKYVETLAMRRK